MAPSDKQRRANERRKLQRQMQRRRERAARRRQFQIWGSVVGALVVVAAVVLVVVMGSDDSTPAAKAPSTPTSSTPAAATYPCSWPAATTQTVTKKVVKPASTTPPKTGTVTVAVKTTQGPMTLTLNRAAAPCSVASFVSLVQQKYFDKTPCHRLVTSGIYVLQCGDPSGTGRGGPGYDLPDEGKATSKFPAGTIAMARTSLPNSGGSQFFIVYKNSPSLSAGSIDQTTGKAYYYTVFGNVSAGESTLNKIAAGGVAGGGSDGKPKLPTTITSATTGT